MSTHRIETLFLILRIRMKTPFKNKASLPTAFNLLAVKLQGKRLYRGLHLPTASSINYARKRTNERLLDLDSSFLSLSNLLSVRMNRKKSWNRHRTTRHLPTFIIVDCNAVFNIEYVISVLLHKNSEFRASLFHLTLD